MTDEEMAKEYATKECCTTCANDFCKGKCECWTFAKNGFLAGLKADRPKWHEANEIQCYEDIPDNKDMLYVWVVNIAKFEKDKPILETRVGSCDELAYDIMAYHLIKWCEIPKE